MEKTEGDAIRSFMVREKKREISHNVIAERSLRKTMA